MSRVTLWTALLLAACAAPSEPVAIGLVDTPDAPADEVLRFIAVGDTGKGNEIERRVGDQMARTCEQAGGCAFALLLGDNIYPSGAESDQDDQLRTKFDEPFTAVPFPFHVVLGNHDYGAEGAGWAFWRAKHEIAWRSRSTKWRLPARHYAFTERHADFFALDTNAIFWGYEADQVAALDARRTASKRPWRIAFGHHPYLSNGKHGDAGTYDALPSWAPGSGSRWKGFFDTQICGRFDVYFAGHDHNLQDHGEKCGVQLFVSGSGSSPWKLYRNDRVLFGSDAPGFALVELTARELKLTFVDADGKSLHTRTIVK